jgi:hypothetical protein
MPTPLPPLPSLAMDIEFDDTDDEFIEEIVPFIIATVAQSSQNTERIRSLLLPGKAYVNELLATANSQRCKEVLRMRVETFSALRDWLLVHTSLKSSRQKEGVSIEEKIVIFLYIVTRGASNRECCERFCYSGRTVSRLVT